MVLRNAMLDYVERNRKLVPYSGTPESTRITGQEASGQNWLENLPDDRISDALPSRLEDTKKGCSEGARAVIEICLTANLGDVFGKRKPIERVRRILMAQGWDRRRTHHVFNELSTLIAAW